MAILRPPVPPVSLGAAKGAKKLKSDAPGCTINVTREGKIETLGKWGFQTKGVDMRRFMLIIGLLYLPLGVVLAQTGGTITGEVRSETQVALSLQT